MSKEDFLFVEFILTFDAIYYCLVFGFVISLCNSVYRWFSDRSYYAGICKLQKEEIECLQLELKWLRKRL